MTLGWQVLPEFRVVQHKKDTQTLRMIQKRLDCGIITVNHDDRNELRVRGINNLMKIVEFFRINKLKTSKLNNFKKFATVIKMMNERKHLKRTGLKEIAEIAATMNKKIKSKYLESSETIR
ncbi:LAGLIDADG family homing endonuclease [Candidatus Woesearchaeota archaeon]|nr:LAGLIDADG family homing endonuclease [Candidatus Woesearchaeota archaeon]